MLHYQGLFLFNQNQITMNKSLILLIIPLFFSLAQMNAQTTYTIGDTEYIYGQTYETTGMPKVKRSSANRQAFLDSRGLEHVPYGYEVDHIIPLSRGGTDSPLNMQLLTIESHARKTAMERSSSSIFYTNPSFPSSSFGSTSARIMQTGPRGGQYYINSSGNKVYSRK